MTASARNGGDTSARRDRRPLVIAHRGLTTRAGENTVEAFLDAVDVGCDMIEFDLRRTHDGVFAVIHDARIAGEAVSALGYAQLADRAEKQGIELCRLEQVLAVVPDHVGLNVEIKDVGHERDLVELLIESRDASTFVITSFFDESICAVRAAFPDVRTGLLLGRKHASARRRMSELFPFSRARRCYASIVAPHYRLLRFGFLSRMKRRGLQVFVWTVNDGEQLRRLMSDPRVAGVVTDDPESALRLRDGDRERDAQS